MIETGLVLYIQYIIHTVAKRELVMLRQLILGRSYFDD